MTTRDTYTTQAWENLPSEKTPISAERLAHIEQGIKDAADKRALKEIYDDVGAKIGLSNTIMSVNGYIVNGNGNILQNGSNICINGNSNNISGSANSISGMGNAVSGTANSVNGMSNTVTGSGGTTIEGYRNKADNANYSHISGADNKMEEGYGYAVFMHGEINECRGSSDGAVFGTGNILKGNTQFVTGKFSKADEYKAFIVGGGTSDTDRKNIYSLDWQGNAVFAGNVQQTYGGRTLSLFGIQMEMEGKFNSLSSGIMPAKVFDTKSALDEWLAEEDNADTLKIGQNIYIVDAGTPDYWWDGTGLQVLETDKAEIESMTYDETMAILNAATEEVE